MSSLGQYTRTRLPMEKLKLFLGEARQPREDALVPYPSLAVDRDRDRVHDRLAGLRSRVACAVHPWIVSRESSSHRAEWLTRLSCSNLPCARLRDASLRNRASIFCNSESNRARPTCIDYRWYNSPCPGRSLDSTTTELWRLSHSSPSKPASSDDIVIQSKQIELVPINRALRELRQLCVDTNEHTRQSKSVPGSIHSRATTHSPSKRDARDSKPRRRRSPSSSDAPIFSGHSCAIAGFVRKNFIYAQHTPVPRRTHRQSHRITRHLYPARLRARFAADPRNSRFANIIPPSPLHLLRARTHQISQEISLHHLSQRSARRLLAHRRHLAPYVSEHRSFFPLVDVA